MFWYLTCTHGLRLIVFHVKFHSVLSYIGAQLVKLKTERNVFNLNSEETYE